MIASAPAEHYRKAIELLLADPNVDSLVVIFIPPLVTRAEDVAHAIDEAIGSSTKPVLATFMGAQGTLPLGKVPSYMFPESAAVALARVTQYGEWLERPLVDVPVLDRVDLDAARRLIASVLAAGGGWLSTLESQALLGTCGVRVAEARVAKTVEEAVAAASAIGYPVVMKALGPTLLHKTESGGVKLGLATDADVRAAFTDLSSRLAERLESVLIQRMVTGGVEMVVGAVNDPAFGPLVMGGTGGIFVELVGDTVFRMCPLTRDDSSEMVSEMKGQILLRGYRGAAPVDEEAFRDVLLRISQLVDGCPEIEEMDINPLLVLKEGAVAADVRIKVGPRAGGSSGRRISY